MLNTSHDVLVVQPFKLWQGHYKKYINSFSHINYCEISFNTIPKILKLMTFKNKPRNFFVFYFARFINILFFNLYSLYKSNIKSDIIFLEYEPLAFLFSRFFLGRRTVYQTVHSIDRKRYSNIVKESFSILQRVLFKLSLRVSNYLNKHGFLTVYIVHSAYHKAQLEVYIGNPQVNVIDYPCPIPKVNFSARFSFDKANICILIFGVVREDKGIFEFLELSKNFLDKSVFKIKVVGKIEDSRIDITNYPQVEFVDSYIPEQEIESIFMEADILLLPYNKTYTGGAGPMKDAASYGLPVMCSNIPVFREVLQKSRFGVLMDDDNYSRKLNFYVDCIASDYKTYSEAAVMYANENNWSTLSNHYKRIVNLYRYKI